MLCLEIDAKVNNGIAQTKLLISVLQHCFPQAEGGSLQLDLQDLFFA